jgi:hypothetical protein
MKLLAAADKEAVTGARQSSRAISESCKVERDRQRWQRCCKGIAAGFLLKQTQLKHRLGQLFHK